MSSQIMFLLLVFGAVVLLSQSLFVSVYSPQRANTKLIKKHLTKLALKDKTIDNNLLISNRVKQLPPFRRWLESHAWLEHLTYKMELSGSKLLGHQYLAIALIASAIVCLLVGYMTKDWVSAVFCLLLTLVGFHVKLNKAIDNRMIRIEEQFPEAMDVLKRGLQAGYAFTEAIKLIFEETEGDLSDEFKIMFNRINFGNDMSTALYSFVQRVPSTSAMAFASAVAIQKSTGGNLAENIENLSKIIRQRFTFKRKVKTLSAEGRLSGWVLVLMPFVLFAVLYLTSPSYVSTLTSTPEGINLLKWGIAGMLVGMFWISKLIDIEV